jgi:hypothetical protein
MLASDKEVVKSFKGLIFQLKGLNNLSPSRHNEDSLFLARVFLWSGMTGALSICLVRAQGRSQELVREPAQEVPILVLSSHNRLTKSQCVVYVTGISTKYLTYSLELPF